MNLEHLRERTRPQHDATETLMPITATGLTLATYTSYLGALYSVLEPWESFARLYHPAALTTLVSDRRRAPLLEEDLRQLDSPMPAIIPFDPANIPGLANSSQHTDPAGVTASFLGAMYVVEGSSLGGQYLARHLEATLGLTGERGAAYFRGYGERTGALWQQFKAVLAALPDSDEELVVSAAQGMFTLFARALSVISTQPSKLEMASLS